MLSQFDYLSTEQKETATSQQLKNKSLKMSNFNLEAPLAPIVHTAWEFSHPLPPTVLAQASLRKGGSAVGGGGGFVGGDGANEHNYRDCRITFPIKEQGVCHGLGGYFETVLYSGSQGPVELSTNPVTMEAKSKDMISWFPIFFPLKVSSMLLLLLLSIGRMLTKSRYPCSFPLDRRWKLAFGDRRTIGRCGMSGWWRAL
jgi:protein arginine N-methyltransferase 5